MEHLIYIMKGCLKDNWHNFVEKVSGSWHDFVEKVPRVIRTCALVLTTPWECLRKPITHILQIATLESQNKTIELWCDNKKTEYRYVAMSGAVVASAVTASFSWDDLQNNATWFTLGTWYGSIVLSLMSVIVAFHHIILFANFGIDPEGPQKVRRLLCNGTGLGGRSDREDLVFIYILQVPGMLLSFSLMSYFMGLSVLIFFPSWDQVWGTETKSAVVYLVYWIFGGLNYFFVCWYTQNV